MKQGIGAALVRFTVATILVLAALAVIGRAAQNSEMWAGPPNRHPTAPTIGEAVSATAKEMGRAVAYALPMAALTGILGGLRPGGRMDRLMQWPLILIAGVPLFGLVALILLVPVAINRPEWMLETAVVTASAVAITPWISRAIRDGVAGARLPGGPLSPCRALVGSLGGICQRFGVMLMIVLVLGNQNVFYRHRPLSWVTFAQQDGDWALVGSMLAIILVPPLLFHLLGDLLFLLSKPSPLPPRRPSAAWVTSGLLLTAALVVMACLFFTGDNSAPGPKSQSPSAAHLFGTDNRGRDRASHAAAATRGSLLLALGASAAAGAVGASIWAVSQEARRGGLSILTPAVPLPSFYPGAVGGILAVVTLGAWPWAIALGIGIAMAPQVAHGLTKVASARSRWSKGGRLAALGGLLVAQALQVELLLALHSWVPVGSGESLGRLLLVTLMDFLVSFEQYLWLPLLFASLGIGGLYLFGVAVLESGESPTSNDISADSTEQVA